MRFSIQPSPGTHCSFTTLYAHIYRLS
jgi:hypothetical protein